MKLQVYRNKFDRLFLSKISGLLCAILLISLYFLSIIPKEINDQLPFIIISDSLKDDLKKTLTHSMSSAEESIFIETFSLSDPKIINTLNRQAQQNISISIICDYKNSHNLAKKLDHRIKLYRKKQSSALMHQKIVIIDDHTSWLGSTNLTSESLKMHSNLIVGFYNKELAQHIKKRALLQITPNNKLDKKSFFTNVNSTNIELFLLPENDNALEKLKEEIRSAKKNIKIAMFTWSDITLAEEIINAHKRGLEISIITNRSSANGANKKCMEKLLQNDIIVYCNNDNNLLHHKYAIIDDKTLISGSVNWTKSGFRKNDENMLIIKQIQKKQMSQLKKIHRNLKRSAFKWTIA